MHNDHPMINCVVVDDEPLARQGIASYAREIHFFNVVGACENPLQLMRLMDQQQVDLIFLDIRMPKMSGIDFLRTRQATATGISPMIIVTTAFSGYALEGYQLNVLDYLLKPVTFDRFLQSANKARDYYQMITGSAGSAPPNTQTSYFFIKCSGQYKKIYFSDILFVESMQNYVTIYTRQQKYTTLLLLKTLEQNLDSDAFIRVHKSYIVSIDKIEGIDKTEIIIQSHRIPISRNYREQVLERVVTNKLWDR